MANSTFKVIGHELVNKFKTSYYHKKRAKGIQKKIKESCILSARWNGIATVIHQFILNQ